MQKRFLIATLVAIVGFGVMAGCTPEARDKYDAAGDSAAEATKKTGDAMATDAAKTGEAVQKEADAAGTAVKNAAENTAKVADNADTTMQVKNAILIAKDLHSSNLNVDTKDKKVILRGSVPTADEKARAEQIAKGVVTKDYTVVNQLTIDNSK